MKRSPDELLQSVIKKQKDTLAIELLNEFHQGYPVENIFKLLNHDNPRVAELGAWICSEMGHLLREHLSTLARDLSYEPPKVQTSLIAAIVNGATDENGAELAQVARLLRSPNPEVRSHAVEYVSMLETDLLQSIVLHLEDSVLQEHFVWLLSHSASLYDISTFAQRVRSHDEIEAMFGLIAIKRASRNRLSFLREASKAAHPSVKKALSQEIGDDFLISLASWEVIIRNYIEILYDGTATQREHEAELSPYEQGKLYGIELCQSLLKELIDTYDPKSPMIPVEKLTPPKKMT